jgi:hypothetical protein
LEARGSQEKTVKNSNKKSAGKFEGNSDGNFPPKNLEFPKVDPQEATQ